ncbi:hypothetical protein GCM10022419_042870 [Nonomuraea rosea]|uniref:Uncharacterized protein n=1 Tax=Nonomuraea rosea TaxID=638574 RepID=A0ABP6WWI8_9ACTN
MRGDKVGLLTPSRAGTAPAVLRLSWIGSAIRRYPNPGRRPDLGVRAEEGPPARTPEGRWRSGGQTEIRPAPAPAVTTDLTLEAVSSE